MKSIAQTIRNRIQSMPSGQLFTPANFAGVGTRASVDQTLMRLVQTGSVERVGHGLYMVPKTSRFGLKAMPSSETIAQTIAESEGATIEIHGAEAARRFGFTTQMPVCPVFNTSGSTRTVRIGNLSIRFQHVVARKLALAGRPAGQALAALWYLGKNEVTPQTFEVLRTKLPQEEFKILEETKHVMPAWLIEVFRKFEQSELAHA